ncbi:uncharacterized protein LOC143143319 [Ptiloglossa arizonensis]|uniref:uncharacterized protein LOC143143319 n=1 Tax=Ptiloglossa arizonensis TaxID=3350558 RepID=UPI003FA07719
MLPRKITPRCDLLGSMVSREKKKKKTNLHVRSLLQYDHPEGRALISSISNADLLLLRARLSCPVANASLISPVTFARRISIEGQTHLAADKLPSMHPVGSRVPFPHHLEHQTSESDTSARGIATPVLTLTDGTLDVLVKNTRKRPSRDSQSIKTSRAITEYPQFFQSATQRQEKPSCSYVPIIKAAKLHSY